MATLRKLITIPDSDFEKMSNFAQKERISFSELIRKATTTYIEDQEKMNLSEYLKAHCDTVSEEEEKEILQMLEELRNDPEYDENVGSELTLEQILHGDL
ncbi:MAG: CopG family transcriptional regulator [Sebaldella sp.]|nr:CopG family transcriptional regulator [Sebaldella sp.]